MPPPDSSGMDVGGPLRLRPLILPTTTPTTRPTTSRPTASAYRGHTTGPWIVTDVDDAPTATVCVPSFIGYVKVTVFVWPAAKETTWLLTFWPSIDSQTVALPAMANVFCAETVIVDAVPSATEVAAMFEYVSTGFEAMSAYQPRATPTYGAVAVTSVSCAPTPPAPTVNVATPAAFVTPN